MLDDENDVEEDAKQCQTCFGPITCEDGPAAGVQDLEELLQETQQTTSEIQQHVPDGPPHCRLSHKVEPGLRHILDKGDAQLDVRAVGHELKDRDGIDGSCGNQHDQDVLGKIGRRRSDQEERMDSLPTSVVDECLNDANNSQEHSVEREDDVRNVNWQRVAL